jgi:hypothetical protein
MSILDATYKTFVSELPKEKLIKAMLDEIESDTRFHSNKLYFMKVSEEIKDLTNDLILLKNSLIASPDENQYLYGVLIHNTLKKLFIDAQSDECFLLPTKEQELRNRKQLDILRKNK